MDGSRDLASHPGLRRIPTRWFARVSRGSPEDQDGLRLRQTRGRSSVRLDLGSWLVSRRWFIVALASLIVLAFELLEYRPLRHGLSANFVFEASFYGILLPAISGIALSRLAASRAELAWKSYVAELKQNLRAQLVDAHSRSEVADIVLQFVRTVTPSVGVEIHEIGQDGQRAETILSWAQKDISLDLREAGCHSADCPLLNPEAGGDESQWALCPEPAAASGREGPTRLCIVFVSSGALIAGSQLYFPPDKLPSPTQIRLLTKTGLVFADALERVGFEERMRGRDDSVEAEHQRIARDVHDSLGQNLAYLRLKLEQISLELESREVEVLREDDFLRGEVRALGEVAGDAYDQMREVLVVLAPDSDSSLDTSLQRCAEKLAQRAGIDLQLHSCGRPRVLPARVQRHVYYIFREAVANVERHARAGRVGVELIWRDSEFVILIEDDGAGFDVEQKMPAGHFGISNMRERAQTICADLDISSQLGHGTQLRLRVPLDPPV